MTPKTRPNDEPVRLLFEMTRDDNPRLYDDLIRFNKGTKRVNRLRFLDTKPNILNEDETHIKIFF